MNYEYSDYEEDQSALLEPDFSIEPNWYLELDLVSMMLDSVDNI
jgi:hypothetical protein